MCFSATASFSAATVLILVGGVAVRRSRRWRDLPFALIPALFGLQQGLEGMLWLAMQGTTQSCAGLSSDTLVWNYSLFSQVMWPVYIPMSVWLMEVMPARRRAMLWLCLGGALVSVFLFSAMLDNPVRAEISQHHIAYQFAHIHVVTASLLYLLGTCVSPLLSSHPPVRLFGLAAAGSAVVAYAVYANWFISVWCFMAGVMSCVVLLYFSKPKEGRRTAQGPAHAPGVARLQDERGHESSTAANQNQ